ncbi:MAG: hypothetical protein JWP77_2418 [Polaromonas sp.]|nr:hypothetical protein [Polaromonas sp.]
MQLQKTLDPMDDIAFFIAEGTHRIATISMNDYGFLLSARMAQTYLFRAGQVLENKRGFDREFFTEVSTLKSMAAAMGREYAQFEAFCDESDRFDRQATRNWREWLSKCAVRAISRSYRGTVSHHLAYKIRLFHSRLSAVLTEA